MIGEKVFVPNILLCGDYKEFLSRIGNRLFKIVGYVKFSGEAHGQKFDFVKDGKFLLEAKIHKYEETLYTTQDLTQDFDDSMELCFRICEGNELKNWIKEGMMDYIVFNSNKEIIRLDNILSKFGCPRGHGVSTTEFKYLPTDNIHYFQADTHLMNLLSRLSIKTLLDVDGYFAKSFVFTKSPNEITEIDCICDEDFFPMKGEMFHHVYQKFSDCSLRHYKAALISENRPECFDKAFNLLKDTADIVITFARNNSPLAKYVQDNKDKFKKIDVYPCSPSGQWIFCYRKTPPQDFAMYVVTHKLLPPEHIKTFPDKYTIINAGATIREDLGYLRDDSGDNISNFNSYINEVTAFYWIWKNTSHTVVGICHYRRFFQLNANGSFLTEEEALKLLEDYDVLIRPNGLYRGTFFESRKACDKDDTLVEFEHAVIRKNLARTHPDYLDAFDYKMNSNPIYFNHSFVMRKNVFDAYCEWLFSFIIDSLKEILKEYPKLDRTLGYFCEAMLTVWLMKNSLRVKEIRYIVKDPFQV